MIASPQIDILVGFRVPDDAALTDIASGIVKVQDQRRIHARFVNSLPHASPRRALYEGQLAALTREELALQRRFQEARK